MTIRRRRLILGLLALAALAALAVWLEAPIREQYYLFKLRSEDPEAQRLAAMRLGEMRSTRALPDLIEWLAAYEESRQDGNGIRPAWEGEKDLVEPLVRIGAPSIRPLIALLGHEESRARCRAREALTEVGPPAVSGLVEELDTGDPNKAGLILESLLLMGTEAREAAPAVIRQLKAGARKTHEVWHILASSRKDAREAVPWVLAELRSPDSNIRMNAAMVLEGIGCAEGGVVPALVAALSDGDEFVRTAAARAVAKLPEETEAFLPALIGLLKERTAGVDPADDTSAMVRCVAAESLAQLGTKATSAIPALEEALRDPNVLVRVRAGAALWKMEKKAGKVLPVLIEAMEDEDARCFVAAELGKIGPNAKGALPALREALGAECRLVQTASALAIVQIEGVTAETIPLIAERLRGSDRHDQWTAVEALAEMGSRAKGAIPELERFVQRSWRRIHREAVQALAKVRGKDAGPGQ